MNKKHVSIIGMVVIIGFALSACTPVDVGLSGAGGNSNSANGNGANGNSSEGNSGGGNSGGGGAGSQGGGGNGGKSVSFYLPQLVMTVTEEGTIPALSDPPISHGEFQVTYPSTLQTRHEGVVELILAPQYRIVNSKKVSPQEADTLQILQGEIDLYGVMKAELIKRTAVHITSDAPEKIVKLNEETRWVWYITPLQDGDYTLILTISVPLQVVDGVPSDYILRTFDLPFKAYTPTPTPSPSPVPTQTPTTLEMITATAESANIPLDVIAAIVTIATGLAGLSQWRKSRIKKEQTANEGTNARKNAGAKKNGSLGGKKKE